MRLRPVRLVATPMNASEPERRLAMIAPRDGVSWPPAPTSIWATAMNVRLRRMTRGIGVLPAALMPPKPRARPTRSTPIMYGAVYFFGRAAGMEAAPTLAVPGARPPLLASRAACYGRRAGPDSARLGPHAPGRRRAKRCPGYPDREASRLL